MNKMEKLTGNKDTDVIILMKLNDKELSAVCSVNRYINKICKSRDFWNKRTITVFQITHDELDQLRKYLNLDGKELYVFLVTKRTGWNTEKLLVLFLLNYQNVINEIIDNSLVKNLPKWINREEFVYYLRGKIAKRIVDYRTVNSGYMYPGSSSQIFPSDVEAILPRLVTDNKTNFPENMSLFLDIYIRENIRK